MSSVGRNKDSAHKIATPTSSSTSTSNTPPAFPMPLKPITARNIASSTYWLAYCMCHTRSPIEEALLSPLASPSSWRVQMRPQVPSNGVGHRPQEGALGGSPSRAMSRLALLPQVSVLSCCLRAGTGPWAENRRYSGVRQPQQEQRRQGR